MKNINYVIVLCLLLLSSLFSFMAWHSNRIDCSSQKGNNEEDSILLPYYFQENLQVSILYDNIQIKDVALKTLNSVINGGGEPKLIFWFSSLSCSSCVEYIQSKLNEHFEKTDTCSIIFVESGTKRITESKMRQHIALDKKDLGLPLDNSNIPFFFVLIDGKIQHFFIPELTLPEYTDIYLKKVKERYFVNKE